MSVHPESKPLFNFPRFIQPETKPMISPQNPFSSFNTKNVLPEMHMPNVVNNYTFYGSNRRAHQEHKPQSTQVPIYPETIPQLPAGLIKSTKTAATIIILIYVFILLWMLAGIAAFIMSLVCLKYSGDNTQKVLGLLLSIFFGPFYWIYYWMSATYCK